MGNLMSMVAEVIVIQRKLTHLHRSCSNRYITIALACIFMTHLFHTKLKPSVYCMSSYLAKFCLVIGREFLTTTLRRSQTVMCV